MEMLGIIKGLVKGGEIELASKILSNIVIGELKAEDIARYSESLKLAVNQ